jgi:hypothetical protein
MAIASCIVQNATGHGNSHTEADLSRKQNIYLEDVDIRYLIASSKAKISHHVLAKQNYTSNSKRKALTRVLNMVNCCSGLVK